MRTEPPEQQWEQLLIQTTVISALLVTLITTSGRGLTSQCIEQGSRACVGLLTEACELELHQPQGALLPAAFPCAVHS